MKEIWKDINRWENKYQVSNLGRVRRLQQIQIFKDGQKHFYPERICTTRINMHGYEMVQLWESGKKSSKQIHRILAEAFIPNPNKLEQVNHKNGIKSDNRLENLEWISRRGNALHAIYELGKHGPFECKPVLCVETGKQYPSIHKAAEATGVPVMCISRVANGLRNHTHGEHWIFV